MSARKISVYVDPLSTSPGGAGAGQTFRAGKSFDAAKSAGAEVRTP